MVEKIDSYDRFIQAFEIDKNELYDFGIRETILPSIDLVAQNWDDLKKRVFNNGVVSIRGYGRDAKGTSMYLNMYKALFNNENVKKDATNNLEPQKIISRLTGYKRNVNLFNYQVSHIYGRTKNVFLFEAPWNLAFIPKIIDPFTGHETKGKWPNEYQARFISHANTIYSEFIGEYNVLITNPTVIEGVADYVNTLKRKEGLTKEILQFEKDVMKELETISLSEESFRKELMPRQSKSYDADRSINLVKASVDSDLTYIALLELKRSKNRSWVQLRNGCLDLLGVPVEFTTQPVKSTSRSFARESQRKIGLTYEEILELLDKRQLGLK